MQCFDTFGFSYPEGEMRMCFGVLLGESGSTRQQISRCQKFVVCWKFGEQHLHCHHGMWVTQCQVTMSAAGSLSLSSSVFLSHWKGGFTPNLWRQRVHRIFRSSSHCQDLDTSESTLFRKKKRCPQSRQQNQRQKRCWNIAFVAPARRNAPEVELFWLEGNTKAQPPRVRLLVLSMFPQGEQ